MKGSPRFETTNWSLVRRAAGRGGKPDEQALEVIAADYWYPIYVFVRRLGIDAEEACDVTQAYFAKLLERGTLAQADPERGALRGFLRSSVRHFVSDWRRFHRAQRRAPATLVSLDQRAAEERYAHEPVDPETPESLFERAWAAEVLSSALEALQRSEVEAGREARWRVLSVHVTGEGGVTYAQAAERLGTSVGAVKVAVHRLRRRLDRLLRAAVFETVAGPGELDDELERVRKELRRQ